MTIDKIVNSKSLSIEVKSGVDAQGADIYSKKSFPNVRTNVDPQKAYDVAEAIKAVLEQPTRSYFLNTSSTLENA